MIDISLVKDSTSTVGTGPLRLDNAPPSGFYPFIAATNVGATNIGYRIEDGSATVLERGRGTLQSPYLLARGADVPVALPSGVKFVFFESIINPGGAAGTGTVTSVGLTMPAGFSVSGSPVTGSGNINVTGGPSGGGSAVPVGFATIAALNTYLTASAASLVTGQTLVVSTEPPGVCRVWNGANALEVLLPGGKIVALAAATNVVLATSGAPSSGTGNNGDIAFDAATGYYFTKASGAWTPTDQVLVSGVAQALTYTSGNLTGYTKNGVTYVLNYTNGVLTSLVGGGVTVTYNYTSGALTSTTLS